MRSVAVAASTVVLAAWAKGLIPDLPLGLVVRRGMELCGGVAKVLHVLPRDGAVVGAGTEVVVLDRFELGVEHLGHNVHLTLRYPKGEEHLVYPKRTWEEVEQRLAVPLAEGRPPRMPGAFLAGPPGTGKTSMIDLLGHYLGVHTVDVEPSAILSKWLGESEKRVHALLTEAEAKEPSLVAVDDAEWLLGARHFIRSEDSPAYLGMLNIVLRKLQDWHRQRRLLAVVAASNVSLTKIDPALLRSGRLGRPIFFPLPDVEAVRLVMEVNGVPPEMAERWAARVVSAGLSMADAVAVANDILDGRSPRLEPLKGRGYARSVVPQLSPSVEELLRELERKLPPKVFRSPRTRLWVAIAPNVGEPLLSCYLTYVCRKPAVLLTDPRYVDEAVYTAATTESVLVVNCDDVPEEHQVLAAQQCDVPVAFIGLRPPRPSHMRAGALSMEGLKYSLGMYRARQLLTEVLCTYYNIVPDETALKKLRDLSDDAWIQSVSRLGLLGASGEEPVELSEVLEV